MNLPPLVAFDFDNTISESKQPITPDMASLITQLLSRTYVAIMSGSTFGGLEKLLIQQLPPSARLENLFILPVSAARCYSYKNGAWVLLYEHPMPPDERAHIIRILEDAMKQTGVADEPGPFWGDRIEDRGSQITLSGMGQQAPIEAKRAWDPTVEKRRALVAILQPLLPECSVAVGGMSSVDIVSKLVNKAYGIREVAKITNVPESHILFIGDELRPGGNDSAVRETKAQTHEVANPQETAAFICSLLAGS